MKVTSIDQLKVGMTVRFETTDPNDRDRVFPWQQSESGKVLSVYRRNEDGGGGSVRVRGECEGAFTWSFKPRGLHRDWYITHDEKGNPMSESNTPKIGDEVEITQVWTGKVQSVDSFGIGLDKAGYFNFKPTNTSVLKSVTVQVIKAAELPWQEGDIIQVVDKNANKGEFRIRGIDGFWYDSRGQRQASHDEAAEDTSFYKPIVRGGRLV